MSPFSLLRLVTLYQLAFHVKPKYSAIAVCTVSVLPSLCTPPQTVVLLLRQVNVNRKHHVHHIRLLGLSRRRRGRIRYSVSLNHNAVYSSHVYIHLPVASVRPRFMYGLVMSDARPTAHCELLRTSPVLYNSLNKPLPALPNAKVLLFWSLSHVRR